MILPGASAYAPASGKPNIRRSALALPTVSGFSALPPPPDAVANLPAIADALQETLLTYGFENVRVTMLPQDRSGIMVVVAYENRRYNRDELHGLGIVLGVTAIHMPREVTHLRAMVYEVNLPVLQLTVPIDDMLAYVNGKMSRSTFSRTLQITNHIVQPSVQPLVQTPIRHRSWLKLDIFIRPSIATNILTERGVANLRFSLLPDAFVQLTPGAVFNVRAVVPVTQTGGFPGRLQDPAVDRILIHQTLRLPLGGGIWCQKVAGLTQFSIGRFTREEVGIANETALTLWDGWLFFRSMVAHVGNAFHDLDTWVAWANGRVRYPPWDLTFSLAGGRFLDGDTGVAASLSRFFGNTGISFFLRHSNRGSLGGINLSLPLTVPKELPPWRLRPRLPDLFSYAQTTTIFTERNVIRSDIGRIVPTGHAIERVFWNRDRLYPVYIRRHLDTLAHAIRKWVDTEVVSRP